VTDIPPCHPYQIITVLSIRKSHYRQTIKVPHS
jgi:hypothetical protein